MNSTYRKRFSLILLLLFLAQGCALFAQLSAGGTPQFRNSLLRQANPEQYAVTLTPPTGSAIDSLLSRASNSAWGFRTFSFGIPISCNLSPANSGIVTHQSSGGVTWELTIEARGAASLQLYFGQFHLPQGGKLFLLSPDGKVLRGAFTEKNNTTAGGENTLAIAPTSGEKVTIYYEGLPGDDQLPQLLLTQVSYNLWDGFRNSYTHPGLGKHAFGEPWFSGDYSCAPNVVMYPECTPQSHSQVLMLCRGNTACSGALINNTNNDGTAYVLTAAHCMNASYARKGDMDYIRETARQTIFFFNFRSPLGNTMVRGVEEQSLAGAEVVAINEEYDMCLLRITGIDSNPQYAPSGGIPPSYMPFYSGWNAEPDPMGSFINLHHPTSSVTRYNRCNEQKLKLIDFESKYYTWHGKHFYIPRWEVGTTAGGSSGSPLYDNDLLIIGALTGGQSTCVRPVNDVFYSIAGCFKKVGEQPEQLFLSPWLAPSSDVTKLKGYQPYQPKEPRRLSYNLYSLRRDEVEELSRSQMVNFKAIATCYQLPVDSKLIGLMLVANIGEDDAEYLPNLVVYTLTSEGKRRELLNKPLPLPNYKILTYKGELEVGKRTLMGWIETFIPLAELDQEIVTSKEKLYIALEADKTETLTFPILRGSNGKTVASNSFVKLVGGGEFIPSDSETIVEELQSKGNWWIDPIIVPLKEVSKLPENISNSSPTALIFGGKLRVYLPEEYEGNCSIAIYSLNGEKLMATETNKQVTDFNLPQTVIEQQRVVVYFTYGNKKHYGQVYLTTQGL